MRVRIDDFEDGAFPPICVVTGAPSSSLYREDAYHSSLWPFVFLPFPLIGWVLAVVLFFGLRTRVQGLVPYSDVARVRARASFRTAVTVGGLGVLVAAGAVLAAANGAPGKIALVVFLTGVVVAIGGFVRSGRPAGTVGCHLARNGRTVDVGPVHPNFLHAYHEQEGRRTAARRAAATAVVIPGPPASPVPTTPES